MNIPPFYDDDDINNPSTLAGVPISPYLFVLVMEKLAHLIENEVQLDHWLPFRLIRNGVKVSNLFFADDLFLFAEANYEQAGSIKACLDDFCAASGEKVNCEKSRIFFSEGVNHTIKKQISDFLGFTMTADLGKNLGVPLLHKEANKSTYNYVLEKMEARLADWKINSLSFVARMTLVSSVMSAIPMYTMQSSWLLSDTCEKIDKLSRNFLWGSSRSSRKIHLVAWDDVCCSKERGGLGLRQARKQNEAFMMKLGWGLINRRNDLWVKLLREKYGCGDGIVPVMKDRKLRSQIWEEIQKNWEKTMKGVTWRLGDGENVRFWKDRWLPNIQSVSDLVILPLSDDMCEAKVAEYVDHVGNWR